MNASRQNRNTPAFTRSRGIYACAFFGLLLSSFMFLYVHSAQAEPVSEAVVRTMTLSWLQENRRPMGEDMGNSIGSIIRYRGGPAGDTGYYLVLLKPKGWLVVPADDQFWPTMSFGGGMMSKEHFEESLWYGITRFDSIPETTSLQIRQSGRPNAIDGAQARWEELLSNKQMRGGFTYSDLTEYPIYNADMRVPPLTNTYWEQDQEYAAALDFNLLARDYPVIGTQKTYDPEPFRVGCVAVATGETMHYFMTQKYYGAQLTPRTTPKHPAGLFGRDAYLKFVHKGGTPSLLRPRVDKFRPEWGKMPASHRLSYYQEKYEIRQLPEMERNEACVLKALPRQIDQNELPPINERKAIQLYLKKYIKQHVAPFLRDIGFILRSSYRLHTTQFFGIATNADQSYIQEVLRDYGFASSIRFYASNGKFVNSWMGIDLPMSMLDVVLRTNLDLGHPVIVAASSLGDNWWDGLLIHRYNHTFVVDGYAFEKKDVPSCYHVSNGAGGGANGWSYNLQQVNVSNYKAHNYSAVYNIFPTTPRSSTGSIAQCEIISGRVLLDTSVFPAIPATGATVRASWGENGEHSIATTNERGVYAVTVPSSTKIRLEVLDKTGEPNRQAKYHEVETGLSRNWLYTMSPEHINHFIGNIWGVDFELKSPPFGLFFAPSGDAYAQDNIAAVLDTMGIQYTPVSPDAVKNLDPQAGGPLALLIEGQSSLHDAGQADSEAITGIITYLNRGGHILVTGKADFLLDTLGSGKNIRMYRPTRNGESLFGNAANVPSQLLGPLKESLGHSDFTIIHSAPRSKHSIMNLNQTPGGVAETRAYYVVRWLDTSPWEARWVLEGADYLTAYRFPFGKSDGTVQYINYPLHANYLNGGETGKKIVEHHIHGLLIRCGLADITASGDRKGARSEDKLRSASAVTDTPALAEGPDIDITPIQTDNDIAPRSGERYVNGTSGNDMIFSSTEDIILRGNGGSDIYYYRMGDGNDTVIHRKQAGCRSALRLHTDITSLDVRVSRKGADLRLDIGNGSVTLKNWYGDISAQIDRVEIYDGTIWDGLDLETLAQGHTLKQRRMVIKHKPEKKETNASEANIEKDSPYGDGCSVSSSAFLLLLVASTLLLKRRV